MLMPLSLPHDSSSPRYALQRGLAVVSLVMSVLWLVSYERMGLALPINRGLYALLITASLIALLVPPRLRKRAVELGTFIYLSVLLVAWLDAFYHSYGTLTEQFAVLKVILWLPAIYGAFFLIYPPKWAIGVASVALGTFIVTNMPHALTTAGDHRLFGGFLLPLALLVGHGACVAALYTFARPALSAAGVSKDVEQLQRLAYYDTLTGIPNRRQMNLLLQDALIEARKGEPFALIMIDFDYFKQINDVFGHNIGDIVLSRAVQRLTEQLRAGDVIGRWGGEEFIVLARRIGHDATRRAERLREAVEARPLIDDYTVTVSCGVTVYRPGDTLGCLTQRADKALYQAKRKGRNRVEVAPNAPL